MPRKFWRPAASFLYMKARCDLKRVVYVAVMIFVVSSVPVHAGFVSWTDWTSGNTSTGSASGSLTFGGDSVDVSYSGQLFDFQTVGGTNYWDPSDPYLSSTVENAPTTSDILQLSAAATRTITFSEAVLNPVLAIVSLNSNSYEFSDDFQVLSYGTGYWGGGTLSKTNPSAGVYRLNTTGEAHGVIQLQGVFTSFSWTSTNHEVWHGVTVGAPSLAPNNVVPEPGTLALMSLGGIGLVGGAIRKRRKTTQVA